MSGKTKRVRGHNWWILTVMLTVPAIAAAAGVPSMFTPGTVISSSAMNQNFKNVTDRLDAIEASLQKTTTVTAVMDNVPGPLGTGKNATFSSGGGTLHIIVSGSAYVSAFGSTMGVTVQLDGRVLGDMRLFANEASSHKAFPTRVFVPSGVGSGNHVITLTASNGVTVTDFNDPYSVTVVETFH